MRYELQWNWKRWSLIPTIGVRTRRDCIVISWLCASLCLDNTTKSYWWSSRYIGVCVNHVPTHMSLPDLEISYRQKVLGIRASILGFNLFVSIFFSPDEDEDLPF